ncbi:MAG: DUF1302 domain-containing protein [Pseudomonadota bacterium]
MKITASFKLRFGVKLFLSISLYQFSISANAVGFNNKTVAGSWDTTLSYGQLYRVQSRSANLIGIANGGTARSVNRDDGNLNYDPGLVSNAVKFTTEIDASIKSTGIFVRGLGFLDNVADDTTRTQLGGKSERLVSTNFFIRDAYLWHEFNVGKMPAEFRVGEQVLSWGESTFIQNSINTINPVDVSALRTPGAELRDALIPVGMVFGSLGLTNNFSVEAYYQYDWEQTDIDPTGSYFSTTDFIGDDGNFVVGAGQGAVADFSNCPGTCTPISETGAVGNARSATRAGNLEPGNGGEYGAAMRLYVPELNGTEFGFYFINYHSRLPIANAIIGAGGAAGNFTGTQYQLSYPDDIQLYGISFNTEIGSTGIALQGEYSFRNDAPLQLDTTELLAATVSPAGVTSQLGTFAVGDFVQGHIERNVSQFQMTATKLFGQILKADQGVLVGEWAITHIHNMPSKTTLLLASPGIASSGNPANAGALGHTLEELGNFADSTSWGYRIAGRLDYNNALFGAVNLQPRFSWRHDVSGITPGPGGNFLAGRKDISIGVRAVYQNEWEADISYTSFLGDSRQNLLHDRDFMAVSKACWKLADVCAFARPG